MSNLLQDLRYGLRLLRLNPGFTAIVVLSLALGTGANTAIFQLIDSLRLRTLPVAHPEQLANVRILDRSWGSGRVLAATPTSPTRNGSRFEIISKFFRACLPGRPKEDSTWPAAAKHATLRASG